jgi:hypothetical protein
VLNELSTGTSLHRLRVFENSVLRRIFGPKRDERPRLSLEDNIKMNIKERGWGGMDWVSLAQDRDQGRVLVTTVMKLRAPSNVGKFLSSLAAQLLKKDSAP